MDCSCIRGDSGYDFYVEAIDKNTLIYQDLSVWMDEENYDLPDYYQVSITPPASSKSITLTLSVNSTNRISKNEIGSIKDGIYCFAVQSCGVKYVKVKAIFPNIQCCVKQAWATLGIERQEDIEEVQNYLKLASINAELNNIKLASSNLDIAKKLLENIKCDCNC